MFQELTVDLRRPPDDRWHLTAAQCAEARQLLLSYTTDLGLPEEVADLLGATAKKFVRPDHWLELESLSAALELPLRDVALCNFYYDALKVVLGCTAFAVDTGDSILHARNLDWWTANSALSRYTAITHFVGGSAGDFTTIGWPGFIGAFSGIAQGRFAVTLNAVLSFESAQLATPVVLLVRSALEEAASFGDAVAMLSGTPLPCDCLLLVTGVRPGEMAVVERTPSRHALRQGHNGFVCVTNDYQKLAANPEDASSEILATSCRRLQNVDTLIRARLPWDPETCFTYLSDPGVQMRITVQQMVFRATTGEYWIKLPEFPDRPA